VFNEDDIKAVKESNALDYLDPVRVAREFINYQKAQKAKKLAMLDAAKKSAKYDTTKAFFNDITHRRNNNKLLPWVEQNSSTPSSIRHLRRRQEQSSACTTIEPSEAGDAGAFSECVSDYAIMKRHISGVRQAQASDGGYNLCNGLVKIVSSSKSKALVSQFYSTEVELKDRVCFSHLRPE